MLRDVSATVTAMEQSQLTLIDVDGNSTSLSQFAGAPLVVQLPRFFG